jgi:GntR family transcriptional regulator
MIVVSEKSYQKKLPQYAVIRETIRREIKTGLYPAFSALPSEKELADRFEVSVLTVRQAVSDLEGEGLVEKSQGKKTTVCPPKQVEPIFVLPSGNNQYVQSKENVEYELIRREKVNPPNEVREKLDLSWTDENVICITRIRSINQSRVSAYDAYLHPVLCEPLLHEGLANKSLIMTMRDKFKLIPNKILHQVEVITANQTIAEYLGIREKKNVMLIESTEYNEDDKPYLHLIEYYPADRYKFQFTITDV